MEVMDIQEDHEASDILAGIGNIDEIRSKILSVNRVYSDLSKCFFIKLN